MLKHDVSRMVNCSEGLAIPRKETGWGFWIPELENFIYQS
jgi:hypothetical protein